MYCSSSLMAAYPKMGPSLPDPVYPPPSTYTAQPYMSFATEASAFYSPMVSSWANSDNLDSWRSLPHHTTWPYDSTMSAYPYTPSYGGLDVRRKNATRESTSTLKAWLYEHIKNPYPTKGEKIMLAIITKMTLTQVSTWFANARRRLKKENKMQWSPRNRTGDEEDDKSVDSETENPQSDNNNNNCSSSNNNNNNNNNNKELRKDKRDGSVDKNHIDEDETIVVDNIIGEDILMSISDRRKVSNSTMTRGGGNDVTSYLACSSLPSNKHSSVAPDSHRTPSSRFQPFTDPHKVRVQPPATQHQKKFSQSLSMPACGNIGLSLTSSLSSSSSASSSSSSLSSSFHSSSPLPPYNIFSQPPGGSNFYPHPSFMHGFTPSYCGSGTGVFSSSREYNCNSSRSLFSHSYKPLTPCGTTDSSSDSSQPFLNLSVAQLPGMMPSSIEGVSKPRIWSLADVATSVVDESPAAVAAVIAPTYSASDSMFGQHHQHFASPNTYFPISSRTTSDDQDKKTSTASLPFKEHDDGKTDSLENEYDNLVMNSVDRRQNQDKSLKNQLLSPATEDRYQQFSSCGGPYSNSYNFPFPERTFQRRQDYNVVNCSSSSSSSSFSLFPGSFFGNSNNDMLQTVQGSSPTYFHTTAYNDNNTLERPYREEKTKNKISIT